MSSGKGAARAVDAQGTLTQSHISPSILVYEAETRLTDRGHPGLQGSLVDNKQPLPRTIQ